MDKLFIFLAVVAVVVVIIIMAIVVKLKKNSTKSKDVSDANLDFLKKSEKGREILASIQLSQAELKRAKLNEDTAGTHERVIEIEKRILDLDREVTEARLHSESVDKKNDASEGKNAGAENLSSGSGKNSSHIAEYREGANNLGRWVFIWSIAITASATLCIVAGLACIASLGFSWVTIPTGLGIIAIWFGMAMLYIPTKISGIATIKEGYVGVLSAFDKYSGTVNPGIFFPIALINSYKSMNVGEQTMPINLVKTNEDDKAVEIDDHVSIGVESTVFYRITKEGAHLALFNINSAEKGGYKKALSKLLESMLKAHFSKEKFSTVNDTRGKSLILELFKPDGVMIDENKNDFSDEELIGLLQKSKNWCDIRDNWGILVLDIVIDNLIFSKEDQEVWNKKFRAEQQLEADKVKVANERNNVEIAKVQVEVAEQAKLKRIKEGEAEKEVDTLKGNAVANRIHVIRESGEVNGTIAAWLVAKQDKYVAIKNGANAIVADDELSGVGVLSGATFAAGAKKFEK